MYKNRLMRKKYEVHQPWNACLYMIKGFNINTEIKTRSWQIKNKKYKKNM
jgi:hypothetical protein